MMDAPPAICQTVDLAKLAPAALEQRRAAARGRMGEMLYFRAGDDLLSFPAAYALNVPDLARFGCVTRSREVSFAFRLSDLAPAGEGAPEPGSRAGAEGAADRAASPGAPAGPGGAVAPATAGSAAGAADAGSMSAGPGASAPRSAAPVPPVGAGADKAAPAAGSVPRTPPPPGPARAVPAAAGAPPAVSPRTDSSRAPLPPAPGSAPAAPAPGGVAADGAPSQKAGPDDMAVRVVALYMGRHADFMGMTRAITSVRKEEARRGFLYALERFPTPAGDRLVRISEDRCLILSLPPDPAAPGAVVDMRFQNEDWSAVVEVPAGAAGRWEAVYKGIERFLAAHLVRNAFRK